MDGQEGHLRGSLHPAAFPPPRGPDPALCRWGETRFFRPDNLVELLKLKREYPGAVLIAGGTGVAHAVEREGANDLISLEGVKELNSIQTTEEHWEIGASVALTQVAEHIGRECLPFNKALRRFASRPVRNRATLGGYLATAWASGQLAPLLMALNARVSCSRPPGSGTPRSSQFFTGGGRTILQEGELIRTIVIPRATETALSARGVTSRLCDVYRWDPGAPGASPMPRAPSDWNCATARSPRLGSPTRGSPTRRSGHARRRSFSSARSGGEKALIETLGVLNRSVDVATPPGSGTDAGYLKQLVGTLFQKFYHQHPAPRARGPSR